MDFFKIIGGGMVVLSTSLAGIEMNGKMKRSLRLTEGFMKGLSFLMDDMQFSMAYLEGSLQKSAAFSDGASNFFLKTAEDLRDGSDLSEIWTRHLEEMPDLHVQAKQILTELGEILGKTDAETQKNRIVSCLEGLENVRQQQAELQKTKGVLYQKCGIAAGILITILLF